jgi:hypothetical protein
LGVRFAIAARASFSPIWQRAPFFEQSRGSGTYTRRVLSERPSLADAPLPMRGAAERALDALSKTVAALRAAEDFDGFLPKVLHILASTFGAVSCALYETEGDTVYLRHWYVDSTVLGPEQMLQLDPERWSLIRLLAMGFTVPAEYLDGQSVSERSRPVVIDHRAGTARPDFDAFTRANGWDLELNTPILVAGKTVGALCIYRGATARYTPVEISLAETLAAQLALAIEARRLSMKARERAVEIARLEEAEAALVRQLAQEAKANAALQEMVDAVSSLPTLDELIPVALGVVSRTFGVGDCGFFDVLPDQPIRVRFWQHHGRLLRPDELTQVSSIIRTSPRRCGSASPSTMPTSASRIETGRAPISSTTRRAPRRPTSTPGRSTTASARS